MNISFEYRSKKDPANIEVRVNFKEGEKYKSVRSQINFITTKSFWNDYKKNTKFRDFEKIKEKSKLDAHLSEINIFLSDRLGSKKSISKGELDDAIHLFYNPKVNSEIPSGLSDYFQFYLDLREYELKPRKRTWQKWNTVKNLLQKFEEDKKRHYSIEEVDSSFVKDWTVYLTENAYSPLTIKKNFAFIKSVCKHAKTKGVTVSPELDILQVNIKSEIIPKIYLSFKEIDSIAAVELNTTSLDNARDWLIISCYTGQRVSDFMRFNKEMIREVNGKFFIDFRQVKTGKNITVPILSEVRKILDKRSGNFPRRISSQRYNEYIKEVCRQAKLDKVIPGKKTVILKKGDCRKEIGLFPKFELVTSHIGRRSFATNYYGKVPTSHIKNITGHSSENMLLRYIGKTSNDTAVESFDFFENAK
ncbi:MAG: tyrosine-type recombinase/integrase [Bacteroidales bacterium]|nr:tyrosine-type recombinase/integrase [Bacteroidales bacterium]